MDEIYFEIGKRDDPADGIVDAVSIFINGRDLVQVVGEMESPFAARDGKPDLAGSYVGLSPKEVFLPSRRFLGGPETYYDKDGPDDKLAVLGCVCGEVSCWPLLVGITLREGTVVWSDFEQPHRRHWRHHGLGPFLFDRSRYLDTLHRPGDTQTQ
jgi:hypothetical protein